MRDGKGKKEDNGDKRWWRKTIIMMYVWMDGWMEYGWMDAVRVLSQRRQAERENSSDTYPGR